LRRTQQAWAENGALHKTNIRAHIAKVKHYLLRRNKLSVAHRNRSKKARIIKRLHHLCGRNAKLTTASRTDPKGALRVSRIIKKYPNRRLYDTETSAYITLADVKQFVLEAHPFEVQDARSGENLTRSILLQIILEEESGGVPMFSADMLANIIRYYGHSMQGLMGNYLERSIAAFHEAQRKFQEQTKDLYGNLGSSLGGNMANLGKAMPGLDPQAWAKLMQSAGSAVPGMMGEYLEKSASSVIGMQEELRKQAMQMFSTFPYNPMAAAKPAEPADDEQAVKPKPKAKSRKRKKAGPV
jgi:polyhydroxyalkanoate synthesis repressor PhaR